MSKRNIGRVRITNHHNSVIDQPVKEAEHRSQKESGLGAKVTSLRRGCQNPRRSQDGTLPDSMANRRNMVSPMNSQVRE